MKKLFAACFTVYFLLQLGFAKAETDSSAIRISLLTCTPGAELYSVFGHSALRVVDSAAGTDIVYNYGTFDFNDPDFYTKFVRGKLMYFVSQVSYPDFIFEYQYFKRGVVEQVLHLSPIKKKKIQSFLFENIREENRYYKYDFLYDNCTTRLRDIIFQKEENSIVEVPMIVESGQTFRDHLHYYLNRAEMKWTALGIDLLLGIGADMPMDNMESMFLPDFLMKGISSARVDNVKLESDKIIQVKDLQSIPLQSSFFVTPLFIISLLSFLLLIPSFGFIKNTTLGLLADRILFISTGLLGIFLLFMWLGTDHESFSKNINLIWAFPLNIFFSFRLNAINKRMQQFFKIWSLMILILIAVSLSFLGMINMALYPLMLLMSYRYWMLSKK
ncbi:MAG: DUF4105 domain-containing protein [Chitinophagia bacterium]|nr:DUF4105 domain-containing protein [Chitinophagia bacterium]